MSATLEKPPIQRTTIKVPQRLYREAEFKVEGEGENQKLRMSISSDVPYLRYDWWNDEEYWEVLSHAPGDVDEARLKAGLPILFNHKRDDYLGRAKNYVNDGHRITLDNIIWSESDMAQQKKADAISGALPYTSVGYSLDDDGEEVGEKEGKPIYKFKWTPFEAGPCTVPADISVGTNRTRDHKPEGEPKEISVKKNIDTKPETTEKRDNAGIETGKTMTPEEQAAADEKARKQREADERREAQERAESVKEGVKAVREREKEIRAIAKRAVNLPDSELERALEDAITNENAVEAFRKLVFEKYFGNPAPIDTPAGEGGADIRVVGERGRKIISIGEAFATSEAYRNAIKSRRKNISVDIPGLTNFRATAATSTITNFNGIVQLPDVIELGVERATVADLLAQGTTNLNAIPYLQEDTFTNAAATVAEGAAKPEFTWDWSQTSAPVKKIASIAKVTDELFADVPTIQSYINARMRYGVEIAEDAQLLTGDGTGANITGLLATSGIQTQAKGGDTVPDAVRKAMTKVESTGFFQPDGAVFHPNDWEAISLLKDSNGQYLAGGPFYAPYGNGQYVKFFRIWGLMVVVTTSMTENTGLVGAFKLGAMIFRRQGLTLDSTNSNEDDFEKNLITLRAEERLALAVWRPKAFCQVTGI